MNFTSTKISKKVKIIDYIKKKKLKKIFVLSGKKSFYKSGAYNYFHLKLKEKKIKFYFKNSYLPKIEELMKIIKSINSFKPEIIIAVGGGSVLDYAKIAHIVNKKNLLSLRQNIKNSRPVGSYKNYPLLAIPTTAGSGAEVTSNAVIYINKKKFSVENQLLIPNFFLLIPEFVMKNSFKIKSSSAFDVISQSIESIISKKSNKISINYAKKSLKLACDNYLNFLKKSSKKNCSKMLLAANFSGKAINISKTTAPHAVSYPFSYFFKLPHGHAVALTLEKFLEFNYNNLMKSENFLILKKKFKLIFKIFKVKDINELKNKITIIKKNMKINSNHKINKFTIIKNLSKIFSGINVKRLKNNPVIIKTKDIKKILLDIK
jgi:alcohol dehydrogenase class IV